MNAPIIVVESDPQRPESFAIIGRQLAVKPIIEIEGINRG